GVPKSFLQDGQIIASEPQTIWQTFNARFGEVRDRLERRMQFERYGLGALSREQDHARLAMKQAEISYGKHSPEYKSDDDTYQQTVPKCAKAEKPIKAKIQFLKKKNDPLKRSLETADGKEKLLPLAAIVRAYPANQLSFWDKVSVYLSRWREFLTTRP